MLRQLRKPICKLRNPNTAKKFQFGNLCCYRRSKWTSCKTWQYGFGHSAWPDVKSFNMPICPGDIAAISRIRLQRLA